MFDLFKKKAEPEAPKKHNSLFSTDIDVSNLTLEDAQNIVDTIYKTTITDFKIVGADGEPVKSAMDDGSEGNPLSLKPVIQPFESIPFVQLSWYSLQTFIGYQIAAIVAQHWLVDKACTMPARDAIRHGYELTVNDGMELDPSMLNKIKKLDKKYCIKNHCVELIRFSRIFGIRIAFCKIETGDERIDKDFYEKPFNIDGVTPGSYKGIVQVDPYWITPELDHTSASDPASLHFYEPTWWRIGGKRYHRSHLIIVRNGDVADILKPTYRYGGVSIPQKIAERVYASERTANEAPMLAMTKRTTIWHMDMNAAIANQQMFEHKMKWFAAVRDNFGVKAMGLDDQAEQFDTALADVDDVIMTQYQIVSAVAEVPSTKLLGTSPKGFNATGEFEDISYHEMLESLQTHDAEPLLDRHYEVLMKSEGMSYELVVNWNPVASLTASQIADINLKKAQTGESLANSGAIDGADERARVIAEKNSGYSGIPDEVPPEDTVLPSKRTLRITEGDNVDTQNPLEGFEAN